MPQAGEPRPIATRGLPGRAPVAALLVAAALGCNHTVHRIGPIAAPAPPRAPAVRMLVFGDFGYRTPMQWLVARAMVAEHQERPYDLALQLGDNLYSCGPDPTRPGAAACRFGEDGATLAPGVAGADDPLFEVNEAPLRALAGADGQPIPIYLVLGNHDVGLGARCAVRGLDAEEARRRRACLSVARRSPAWRMPARHYVIDRGAVRVVAIDTNVVAADYGGFTLEDELAFLDEALRPCGPGRPCFVIGHHPPAAAHAYRAGGMGRARMERLVRVIAGRARAFFGGHAHSLGHVTVDGLEVFLSGSTAMAGYGRIRTLTRARAQPRFATTAWGFAELEVDGGGYWVRFLDFQGTPLHCCEAEGRGPCRPVTCR